MCASLVNSRICFENRHCKLYGAVSLELVPISDYEITVTNFSVQLLYWDSYVGEPYMQKKILIACTDADSASQLCRTFTRNGHATHIVRDDADMLLEILENDYLAAIYDLEIPAGGGLKMVRILRTIRPKLALIAISEEASTEFGGRVMQEGVSYFAVKPLNFAAIENTVLRLLE